MKKSLTKSAQDRAKKKSKVTSTIVKRKTYDYYQVKTFFFSEFGNKKVSYHDDVVNDWLFHNRAHIKEIHDLLFDIQEGVTIVTIFYTQTLTIKTGRVKLDEDASRAGKD